MVWIAVAVGGALGSMARHLVSLEISHRFERPVPWAVFVVNVIGCLVIGLLAGRVASGRLHLNMLARTFIFVGVLGGFTTFSSFGLDTFTLAHGGEHVLAIGNIAVQTAVGFLAVWAGYRLAIAGV